MKERIKINKDAIFIDTSGFIAAIREDDQFFRIASVYFNDILKRKLDIITTNLIISETYPLIYRMSCYKVAMKFLDIIKEATKEGFLNVIFLQREHDQKIYETLVKYNDQDLSYVDASSFIIMRDLNIKKVFGFDKHFRVGGFYLVPEGV
ncbi:MAG: uncharacterized protein PWR06_1120 [Thermoanaerobacteraceae bacterium]|nr:uncharacterized protein [Thermoanaerobacteraceae bacterium]